MWRPAGSLNLTMSHLMPETDRNAMVIDKQWVNPFRFGSFNVSTPSSSNWHMTIKGLRVNYVRVWFARYSKFKISHFHVFVTLYWVSASCCACNNEWVQQSFICNNVSACFIKHVYHNMFWLKFKPSSGVTLLRMKDCCTHSLFVTVDL
jgi:hypothetical protein